MCSGAFWKEAAIEFDRCPGLAPEDYDHWCVAATLHAAHRDAEG